MNQEPKHKFEFDLTGTEINWLLHVLHQSAKTAGDSYTAEQSKKLYEKLWDAVHETSKVERT